MGWYLGLEIQRLAVKFQHLFQMSFFIKSCFVQNIDYFLLIHFFHCLINYHFCLNFIGNFLFTYFRPYGQFFELCFGFYISYLYFEFRIYCNLKCLCDLILNFIFFVRKFIKAITIDVKIQFTNGLGLYYQKKVFKYCYYYFIIG